MPDDVVPIDLSPIRSLVPNLEQYFGLWAVEESRFLALLDGVSRLDLVAHVRAHEGDELLSAARIAKQPASGTTLAVVDIQGTLTKRGSSFSDAGSTVRLRQAIRSAAADPEIGAIILRIDSPGGTTAGTADLAAEVASAREKKPVYAFVEDLAASAAYWVASQADKIVANDKTALIGSIGTYVGLYDMSGMAAREGVKAIVVRSGKFKGAGFPGTEISAEQIAYYQEIVSKTQAEFSAAVAAGRKLSAARVEELADGRVFLADDAKSAGLVDAIQSFEATVDEVARLAMSRTSSSSRRSAEMSEPTAATYAELKAAFPKADAAFIVSQLDAQATTEQARAAYQAALEAKAEAATAKADAEAKARAEAEEKAAKSIGVDPVPDKTKATDGSDAQAEAEELAAGYVKRGMTKEAAWSRVMKERPDLRAAIVEEANRNRPQRRR